MFSRPFQHDGWRGPNSRLWEGGRNQERGQGRPQMPSGWMVSDLIHSEGSLGLSLPAGLTHLDLPGERQAVGTEGCNHRRSWRTGVLGQGSLPAGHTCRVTGEDCVTLGPPHLQKQWHPCPTPFLGTGLSSAHLSLVTPCGAGGKGGEDPGFTENRPSHTHGWWNSVGRARGGGGWRRPDSRPWDGGRNQELGPRPPSDARTGGQGLAETP